MKRDTLETINSESIQKQCTIKRCRIKPASLYKKFPFFDLVPKGYFLCNECSEAIKTDIESTYKTNNYTLNQFQLIDFFRSRNLMLSDDPYSDSNFEENPFDDTIDTENRIPRKYEKIKTEIDYSENEDEID